MSLSVGFSILDEAVDLRIKKDLGIKKGAWGVWYINSVPCQRSLYIRLDNTPLHYIASVFAVFNERITILTS